jgi:hypothetical protein
VFFKAKIAGKVYQLDKLTLGEARLLKREFGLSDLAYFSNTDPDVIVGLLAICIKRDDESLTMDQATEQAEALDIEDFDPNPDAPEEEPEEAPLEDAAADVAAAAKRKKPGK